MSGYWDANWQIWISAFCVIGVYTYLFKDNALYRIIMQVFIGVNLGYQAVVQWRDVLYPQWWLPMIDGFKALFGGPGSAWGALWSLVGVLGILFYFQLSRKHAHWSKIAIGITIGIGAGLTFKSQFGQNMPQVLDAFKPLAPAVVRPQPRVAAHLPGSAFPPAVDGSLAIFVSGRRVSAAEILGGVEIWRTTLPSTCAAAPSIEGDEVQVPCTGSLVRLDRSTGRVLGQAPSVVTAQANALSAVAKYREPQFAHGVELAAHGAEVVATALRSGVAERVLAGDRLWAAAFPEPITGVESLDGIVLVSGRAESQIWEIPPPQPKLTGSDYFDNWVSVITVVCVMSYFFFTFRRRGPIVEGASNLGRWLLMIGFGAFFGNTVMTRMSFLLDRLMFLIDDWLRPFYHQFFK